MNIFKDLKYMRSILDGNGNIEVDIENRIKVTRLFSYRKVNLPEQEKRF